MLIIIKKWKSKVKKICRIKKLKKDKLKISYIPHLRIRQLKPYQPGL